MNYKISIGFLKGQNPAITQSYLVERYTEELQYQQVSKTSSENNTIHFSNDAVRFVWDKYADKFSKFSSGTIRIVNDDDEYGVYLEADQSNLFKQAGIAGAFVAVSSLLTGLSTFAIIIGAFIFVLTMTIKLIGLYVFFPVYFRGLRNNIEEEMRRQEK
jgi:ABC-type multidrug transport system fused ATPase/permease subunit